MLEVIQVLEKMTKNIWKTFEKKCTLLMMIENCLERNPGNK